jgi:hypothetical protein
MEVQDIYGSLKGLRDGIPPTMMTTEGDANMKRIKQAIKTARARSNQEEGHAYAWGGGSLLTIVLVVLLIILIF